MKTNTKLMLAKGLSKTILAARGLAGQGAETTVVRDGITWGLDLREGIDLAIYLGQYENATKEVYQRLIKPGSRVVDVGANIGAQTLKFARLVGPQGVVVAVEPTDYAFGKLKRNLSLNPQLNGHVKAIQAVVLPTGSDSGNQKPVEIHSSWPLSSVSDEGKHPKHGGVLQSISGAQKLSLDDIVQAAGLDRIDFIKIDVDGFEKSVLESGKETFKTLKPIAMIEFAPYLHDGGGAGFQELLDLIGSLGYTLEIPATGERVALKADVVNRLCPDGSSIDLLGRPAA